MALPFALLRLWWRGFGEPGYRQYISERLGFGTPTFTEDEKVIWLHAVSVGETRAAAPLVEVLLNTFPNHKVLLTHMTPTGRATAEKLFAQYGGAVSSCYLPYDLPSFANTFFTHVKPQFGLIMETEIWPNIVRAAKRANVPVFLINARLSQRSANGYAKFGSLARSALQDFSGVAAQSTEHAQRFRRLGTKDVQVFGNIKFDVQAPIDSLEKAAMFRERIGKRLGENRLVLCCASTREGEEALILKALSERLRDGQWPDRILLLLVPRHPQRFAEVAAIAVNYKMKVVMRSTLNQSERDISSDTQVLVGDSMGEMAAYYGASDLAFIGGSLLPFGAQNLIEACAAGCPVLIGPHTYNFAEATQLALDAGAALTIADADEMLLRSVQLLVGERREPGQKSSAPTPKTREDMVQAALLFSLAHQGATLRTVAWVQAKLIR